MLENFELSLKSKEIIKKTLNVDSLDEIIDMDYRSSRKSFKPLNFRESMMQQIRLFFMWLLFSEKCTCKKGLKENEDAGCYLCSRHFRLLPEIQYRIINLLND
jgi:hypothetical protein